MRSRKEKIPNSKWSLLVPTPGLYKQWLKDTWREFNIDGGQYRPKLWETRAWLRTVTQDQHEDQ